MSINQAYSYQDFTGQTFLDVDPDEFSNSEIVGSCFYQDNRPRSLIFPAGMMGVTFLRCNLDNVEVLPPNVVELSCCNRQCQSQNDGQDWEVDVGGKPVKPLNEKQFLRDGLSTDPESIPAEKLLEMKVLKSEYDAASKWTDAAPAGNRPPQGIDFWYKEKPVIVATRTAWEEIEVGEWDGIDKLHFDSLPTERPAKSGRIGLVGLVTRHTIRGKSWRFRGE